MKKIFLLIIIVLLLSPNYVWASEKIEVYLSKCVDGDTAKFKINNKVKTTRFLAIDTPESVHPKKKVERYGKEASNYTCNKLTRAKKIEIEYDSNSTKTDKYDRVLAWVYVDGKLLQKDLVSKGYAKVAYLYGDYKYNELLKNEEKVAKSKKLKIWDGGSSIGNSDEFYDDIGDILIKIVKKVLNLF